LPIVAIAVGAKKALPFIMSAWRTFGGKRISVGDKAQAIWKSLPAEAINAHVGEGGWWYDNDDNHRLSQLEADDRKKQVAAAAIGATIGDNGWWFDNDTGVKLSFQDSIDRFAALTGQPATNTPSPLPIRPAPSPLPIRPAPSPLPIRPAPRLPVPSLPPTNTKSGTPGGPPAQAGIMSQTMMMAGAAALVLFVIMQKRK
jgi:hypothetical protein